jgi:hypothetical protein
MVSIASDAGSGTLEGELLLGGPAKGAEPKLEMITPKSSELTRPSRFTSPWIHDCSMLATPVVVVPKLEMMTPKSSELTRPSRVASPKVVYLMMIELGSVTGTLS